MPKPFQKLVFIGMRGLPADLPKAGGGERETEAKAVRLAHRGHAVTVYCRWHYNRSPETPYHGVNLISLPSIPTKSLDTFSHTLIATVHAILFNKGEIFNLHGMGNALFLPLIKLTGKKSVVYMDGVDWERPKWGKLASLSLKIAAYLAFRLADKVYIDNETSKNIFAEKFQREAYVITLAADIWDSPGTDTLKNYCVKPDNYILFVGLLRPDKGVHILIEAYNQLDTDTPLVIIGDNLDDPEYVQHLKEMAGDNVLFPGFVYGNDAQQLFANCHIYVQPSLMEGNSPSLMSAMACSRCVVVNGIPQNLETIGDAGLAFKPGSAADLFRILNKLLNSPEQVQSMGALAKERIETVYNWETVVDQLEALYDDI
jgi:glycosyltransferase involved in cell wall biosynthesis